MCMPLGMLEQWKVECLEDDMYYAGKVTEIHQTSLKFTYPQTDNFHSSTETIALAAFARRAKPVRAQPTAHSPQPGKGFSRQNTRNVCF